MQCSAMVWHGMIIGPIATGQSMNPTKAPLTRAVRPGELSSKKQKPLQNNTYTNVGVNIDIDIDINIDNDNNNNNPRNI